MVSTALGRCVPCLEPKDRHVADVVGSPDLDQRFPTLEARGSNLGREDFATALVPSVALASNGGVVLIATLFFRNPAAHAYGA